MAVLAMVLANATCLNQSHKWRYGSLQFTLVIVPSFTEPQDMLGKVEYGGVQKYVKVPHSEECFDFSRFLQDVADKFGLQVELFTEDIFDELLKSGVKSFKVGYKQQPVMDLTINLVAEDSTLPDPEPLSAPPPSPVSMSNSSASSTSSDSTIILPSVQNKRKDVREMDRDEAKERVRSVLRSNPKGEEIFKEYDKTKTLSDATRRQMVNILVADMTCAYGRVPPISVRTSYALGIVTLFPYLQDPYSKNGFIDQDFSMMFGDEVSGRFLAKWPSYFKNKVLAESQCLPSTSYIEELQASNDPEAEDYSGWDGDISALLLLLHLLPPTSKGHKKSAKISSAQAAHRLEGASLTAFLEKVDARQPFLLCVGEQRKEIQRFFIMVDQKPIPSSALTSVAAFDVLFKAHFVFSISYDEALSSFYTFIQTTVYNIDVGNTKESPRVKELRARLLQEPPELLLTGPHQNLVVDPSMDDLSGQGHDDPDPAV
ncbi:hypothetical protein FQA47_020344 [Oryzias melastigma]|uniref:Uncharacterized protein n=1 Tax=Oryzias melastigma TaxID=30732 RepID=A0A834CFB0_ORYME|nr:hypothetical protein FQA47_020344 [Oryzias melastigma]